VCSPIAEQPPRERALYNTLEKYLSGNQIKTVSIGRDEIEATLRSGKVIVAARVPPEIAAELERHGVEFSGQSALGGDAFSWMFFLAPLLLLLPFLFLRGGIAAVRGGAATAMTKSKAKIFAEAETKTTFRDVAGVDEAKEELQEIVAFLKDPKTYGRLGAHARRASCWPARPGPARPCWPGPWPEKPGCRSCR
jgi:cell division protease FtsH